MRFACRLIFFRFLKLAGLLVLATLFQLPSGLSAQAPLLFNPRVSPANPDLIAYEALVGDRQELTFYRVSDKKTFPALSTRLTPGVSQIRGLSGGRNVSLFSGDIDWQPVIADGALKKQWFAYVATDRGVVKLFVNYIDANGKLANEPPLQLPFAGSARQPRWSPDGRHLVFTSDSSALHIFWNVDQVLSAIRNVAALRAVRVTDAGTPILFPSWSPRSNYLAYQVERDMGGVRRTRVEVIGVDTAARIFRGPSVVVTGDLVDVNAYRPSWSPDARYIALYADRDVRSTGDVGALDIAVVELQTEPGTGRVVRGVLQRGQSSRVAQAVVANVSRGPSWTRATTAGIPQPALVYAEMDSARNAPVYLHMLDAWLGSQGRDAERIDISAGFNTTAHREISVVESNGFVRFAYVAEGSGGEVVNVYDDPLATWARGPEPVLPIQVALARQLEDQKPRKIRGSSLPLAFVFPGAGQLAGSHKAKGAVFTTAAVVGAALFMKGMSATKVAADDAASAIGQKNLPAYTAAASTFNSERSMQMVGAGTLGAAWIIGIVDAAMQRKTTMRVSAIGKPMTLPVSNASVVNFGLRVSTGTGRR